MTKVHSIGVCPVPAHVLPDPVKQPVLQRHLIARPGLDLGPDPGLGLRCPAQGSRGPDKLLGSSPRFKRDMCDSLLIQLHRYEAFI